MRTQYYRNPSLRKLEHEYKQHEAFFQSLKRDWNQLIRNYYIKNMGVSLVEGDNRQNITIFIKAAPSQDFIDIIEDSYPNLDFQELYILSKYNEIAQEASPFFQEIQASHHLNMSIEYANYRLKEFDILRLTQNIFPFLKPKNKDVFGCYFLKDNHIEIYIFPIVLFCILHGLDVSAFVVMVLAHELAHGYNHIGLDKDKRYWENFEYTDHFVAEGLAQFYTLKFINQYIHRNIKLIEVFERTLDFQPEPYRIFQEWDLSLEQMYNAFIEARRNGITQYHHFSDIMMQAQRRIRV